jgi:predicted ATPase
MGPREYYPVEDPSSIQVIGARGERAVGWLYCERDASVQPELALPSAPPTRLRQVEERMRRFFPGFSLDVQQIPQTNVVTLGLRTSEATDYHRPIHVGFGLTQVLPIVVAALSTQRGGILLVENPEVHLHPAGQTRMGSFLADVAASGVQVLVETHSDHVLNGVRLAVKMKRIASDDVQLHFFRDRGLHSDQVVSPMIGPDGILDYWPEGFFDQFDKDMNNLAGWPD